MVSAWRNFKNIFSGPLFTINFRPEMLKFHPYFILTRDTMVGFVIFCVLTIKLFNYRLMRMDCIKKVIGDIVMKVNQNVQYQTKIFLGNQGNRFTL